MKKRIHVNQHAIKRNAKTGSREPVITCKTYKSNDYAFEVEILGPSRVIYSPDKPLSCGARVWIETEAEVVLNKEQPCDQTKKNDKTQENISSCDSAS